jgi:hypothetical protein
MTYKLWVRWAQRDEALSTCAARFCSMLEALATIAPDFAHWFKQSDARATAFKPSCAMPPREAELQKILLQGRHFTSASRELIPDLATP